jgi:ribosomal protein S18 acetylase RimI-like enzyme
MEAPETLKVATDAFVTTWRLMANPAIGMREQDGILCAGTGGAVPYCNQANVVAEPADPSSSITAAIKFFEDQGLRFVIQVPHGSKVLTVIAAHGLIETGILPFMILDPIKDSGWRVAPEELEIVRARDARDIQEINRILNITFGMPMDSVRTFRLERFLDNDDVKMFIGRVGGKAVTTATSVVIGETAGIFQVGTLEQHRGKGLGEVMTAQSVRAAADAGARIAFLQASNSGFPIYKRMGFQTVTSHTLFERPS